MLRMQPKGNPQIICCLHNPVYSEPTDPLYRLGEELPILVSPSIIPVVSVAEVF